MRGSIIAILFFMGHSVFAQLTIKPIEKYEGSSRGRQTETKVVNPASLPFWDDFSITADSPNGIRIWGNDTTSQWNAELSKDVYVNATLAVNPPTYKVATFDGVDVDGRFHGSGNPWADQLVSDTINLQSTTNVVLSFYWQAGGNVEMPDEGDSLILQFHRIVDGNSHWETVWKQDGGDLESDQDSVFTQEAVTVSASFRTQKFLFRFQSFGDKNGPFDAWHVDWIYLNENRGAEDFYYLDRGLSGQIISPFSPYKTLPIHQFKANESTLSSFQKIQAFNLDKQPQPTEYILVIRNNNDESVIDSVEYGFEGPLLANPDPFKVTIERFIELNGLNLSSIPNEDSLNILSEVYLENSDDDFLDGTNINLKINDTIRTTYLLHNYYAFDDGTAEFAVGNNVNKGQVAVQYWLEERDTLTHVDIHFPKINPLSDGRNIILKIYKQLNDEGVIRSQRVSVRTASFINEFQRFQLASPVVLSDTFYVAYEQDTSDYVGVGFDRSNPEASKYIFQNNTGVWERNTKLSGALMVRPVFGKPSDDIVANVPDRIEKLTVYPNPTSGTIQIDGSYESISVIDFSGRILIQERVNRLHDFSSLKAGLYLLTIHRKEGDQTIKIIKE